MSWSPEPTFVDGPAGRIFALYFPPQGEMLETLVYLPPFAEEMNRCRATVARQAFQLSALGCAVLLVDPFGTGDSEGELTDASWETWLGDVAAAIDWAADRALSDIVLWGFRTGALLAADVASRQSERIKRLMFWQPVLDGKLFVTQTLRSRVAFLMDRALPAETTDGMREALASGQQLEVAGYLLSGRLVADLDQKKLTAMGLTNIAIDWFELVAEAGRPLTPASRMAIAKLTEAGCNVNEMPYIGPPIWQLHKRDDVPDLVESTTAMLRSLHEGQ